LVIDRKGRKMRKKCFVIFHLLLLFSSTSSVFAQSKTPHEFPVVSFKSLSVVELNYKISVALKTKEEWVLSPLSMALKFHKPSDVRFVNINSKSDRAECPQKSVVTIVEDGYLDDSLRGKWLQFHFERKGCNNSWRVKEAREAYLCGREGLKEVFTDRLCP